jgi:HSP20 family molecular chaperone IbpA
MKHRAELTIAPKELPGSSLLKRMQDVHDTVARRAYELFASSGFSDGHDLADWFSAESDLLHSVPLEVSETEKEITITAALPGFTAKDIEIRVESGRVLISGQREERSEDNKKGDVVYSERRSNQVFRAIHLPSEVDPDKAMATLASGELEITLPKKETGKQISIEEKAA